MFAKTLFIVFLATLSVTFAGTTKEDDLVNTILSSGTNIMKEVAKVATNDPDKYTLDFNDLYKKYEVQEKANQARNYLQTQFKRGIELTNEYVKRSDIKSEEELKKSIEIIKKDDPVLAEKLHKLHEKTVELDRISEDIIKYVLDADKIIGYYEKTKASLHPLEQKLAETIKKLEVGVLEVIKKGKKL